MGNSIRLTGLFFSLAFFITSCFSAADESNAEMMKIITADWEKQEKQKDRTLESPTALLDLVDRAEKLTVCLEDEEYISAANAKKLRLHIQTVRNFLKNSSSKISPSDYRKEYISLRTELRNIIFENPLVKDIPIVFLQEDRYIWQLIHEYLSFYYRYTNARGGDFLVLDRPGQSFKTRSLTSGKFPRGVFSTPALSYDAQALYFAFADFSKVVPEDAPKLTAMDLRKKKTDGNFEEYFKEKEGKFHLFRMNLTNGSVQQLTDGPNDDFDPCLLPDGDLVFVSTRRGGFARCTGLWEPVQTSTLHKLLKNGEVKCLSWHETNEWNPSVLKDGRIIYTRWDYVDREAARYMNLWITNPDGTGAQALFGNYTEKVVAALQAKEVPHSNKILFLGSGHHIAVGGTLALLDPTKVKYDPASSEDTMECLETITPDIGYPETPTADPKKYHVSDHYYYGPYPLSEDFYLVSYSHEANGGYLARPPFGYGINGKSYIGSSSQFDEAGKLGLYYRDRFGNLELIYEDAKISCRYPIQLKPRDVPAVIPSKLPEKASEEGTFVLSDVYESVAPISKERPITELRVFELLPKYPGHMRNDPKIGHAFAENARNYLGSVPVEADGSAHFKAPACKPLYFQAVDAEGRAVQTMVSDVYLMPGEKRGCIGCHEQAQTTQKNLPQQNKAMARPASKLVPGPKGSSPFSYVQLVQPILDRACLSCHDQNGSKPELTGKEEKEFTVSFNKLRPYLAWYEWGGKTIRRISSRPELTGSRVSPLIKILTDKNHQGKITLSENDRRSLYLWLDANVPFYGTSNAADQQRQRKGETIPVPVIKGF